MRLSFQLRYKTKEEALAFLEKCKGAAYQVTSVETRPAKKSPAPPFTTSTLQQEASRKLGFSVANTMRIAQQLYEAGFITYMRTDSVILSKLALSMAKDEIKNLYGEDYVKTRQYSTKSKGAQEAHEAIRPTYMNNQTVSGNNAQSKLYELIWKRTIASQMSDALLEKTSVNISISTNDQEFIASGEVIKFDGFLKVYRESSDEEGDDKGRALLPPLVKGDKPGLIQIDAEQRFTIPPRRYTEASLVKKLEELGIGRPSTYAPTISTVQKREYVEKGEVEGFMREITVITMKNDVIAEQIKSEKAGFEKGKLLPTDLGTVVNKFLLNFFSNILDYNFTANVEKDFDKIADGKKVWSEMIDNFYVPFHKQIAETEETSRKFSGEKLLGQDPKTGENVYVKIGRFGPVVQIGETESPDKPRFAGLKKGQSMENITLEDAMELFKFPRKLGNFEEKEMTVAVGKFGPYVKHDNQYFSLGKEDNPANITQERAVEIIKAKRIADKEKIIQEFEGEEKILVLNGRYGPYIAVGKSNYKIPKDKDPAKLSLEECMKIISTQEKSSPKKAGFKKKKSSK